MRRKEKDTRYRVRKFSTTYHLEYYSNKNILTRMFPDLKLWITIDDTKDRELANSWRDKYGCP